MKTKLARLLALAFALTLSFCALSEAIAYPMNSDQTLTIWSNSNALPKEFLTQEESPFLSGLNKRLGVTLNWEWPTVDAMQAFNLMIASNELPDIICLTGLNAKQYIEDGYFIPLNEYIDDAPNYMKFITDNNYLNEIKDDDGVIYGFSMYNASTLTYAGPLVRKDWLDAQALDMPVTIDDWTRMLRAFKDAYGAGFATPAGQWGRFADPIWGAYGIRRGFYIDDGKVVNGFYQPAYKDFLELMRYWYDEGLIDPDIATLNDAGVKIKVLNDKTGAVVSSKGMLNQWITSLKEMNSSAEWVAAPYPVLNEGDPIEIIHMASAKSNCAAYITSACKDVSLAARALDWNYSEEGILYWNFGVEGVSFEYVDGVPRFKENITDYPGGMSSAVDHYTGMQWWGPSVQMAELGAALSTPESVAAVNVWTRPNNMLSHLMPDVTATSDEGAELSTLLSAIETYQNEMFFKFMLGEESLDSFDAYLKNLADMGMERVLEIKQAQYDRYMSR